LALFICKIIYMATKTVALDSKVYTKLALLKMESESFSHLIDRLIDATVTSRTVSAILSSLDDLPPLPEEDARAMEKIVQSNREEEDWSVHAVS